MPMSRPDKQLCSHVLMLMLSIEFIETPKLKMALFRPVWFLVPMLPIAPCSRIFLWNRQRSYSVSWNDNISSDFSNVSINTRKIDFWTLWKLRRHKCRKNSHDRRSRSGFSRSENSNKRSKRFQRYCSSSHDELLLSLSFSTS